jgi:hypothetical protein
VTVSSYGNALWHDYPNSPEIFYYLNEPGRILDKSVMPVEKSDFAPLSRQDVEANHLAQLISK